jgi:hypothetical protein
MDPTEGYGRQFPTRGRQTPAVFVPEFWSLATLETLAASSAPVAAGQARLHGCNRKVTIATVSESLNQGPTVKLRALITIDIDAEDFIAAADHQRRIATLIEGLKGAYEQADLSFRERRPRPLAAYGRPPLTVRQGTGRLHDYDEL